MTNTTWRRIADDPGLHDSLLIRARALRETREWFWNRGFIEVDTPVLAPWAGMEPHLVPMHTDVGDGIGRITLHHQTSPEYALKKLLAAGMPDCFSLVPAFRNDERGPLHEPEFTILEWYRLGNDYTALMDDTADFSADLARSVRGTTTIEYGGKRADLAADWERVTVADAMRTHAGVDIESHADDESLRAHAREMGHDWVRDETWETLFFKLFIQHVEPNLGVGTPTILCEYPERFGALARRKPGDARVVERFETYVCGVELCNAFSELTDATEQRVRLEREHVERAKIGADSVPVDEDFLDAVADLPECTGNALGMDRLIMLIAGEQNIQRVRWFPFSVFRAWNDRHNRR